MVVAGRLKENGPVEGALVVLVGLLPNRPVEEEATVVLVGAGAKAEVPVEVLPNKPVEGLGAKALVCCCC